MIPPRRDIKLSESECCCLAGKRKEPRLLQQLLQRAITIFRKPNLTQEAKGESESYLTHNALVHTMTRHL